MSNKNIAIQIKVLFWITITNFIAQIPYFFHNYYHKISDLKILLNLPMLSEFVLFLIAYILLIKNSRIGYWLMIVFLSTEFLFYLSNAIFSYMNGVGFFPQVYNPNLILRIVFDIGYFNLLASGYFLFILIRNRKTLVI